MNTPVPRDGWSQRSPDVWYFATGGHTALVLLHVEAAEEYKYMWREMGSGTWWRIPLAVASPEEAMAVTLANWRMS